MIGLMQEGAGEKIFAGLLESFALGVLGADSDDFASGDFLAESGNAQATFFAFLLAFDANDFRIDENDLRGRVFGDGDIDDSDAAGDPDLGGGETDTFGGVHRLEHVVEKRVKLGGIEFGDGRGGSFKDRVAIFHDRINHNLVVLDLG